MSVPEKGQATIPKELREKHGIDTPGKVRVFENDDGEIVVRPVGRITEMQGFASGEGETPGTDQLRESRRRDRQRAERLERITRERSFSMPSRCSR